MRFMLGAVIWCCVVSQYRQQELVEAPSSMVKLTGLETKTNCAKSVFSTPDIQRLTCGPVLTSFCLLFSANCRRPLGIASGEIRNEQITVPSAYNNDFATFGSQRARLNLTSWPPGYRADPNQGSGWIKVELGKEMVITAIATQGFGDDSVEEWIKQYMVMYSNGGDYLYFKDLKGVLKVGCWS